MLSGPRPLGTMQNHPTDSERDKAIDSKAKTVVPESAQVQADSLCQRYRDKAHAWLVRAEKRVTEGFRVPPGGG